MFLGSSQGIEVSSDPATARARTPSGISCTTPCKLELRRNDNTFIVIEHEQCDSSTVVLERSLSGGNLTLSLLGFLPGLLVDAATGSLYSLRPDPVHTVLACNEGETGVGDES